MIRARTVVALGFSQLIIWGVTYYLVGGFGTAITEAEGWSRSAVHGGFSIGLLVMGLISPWAGRMIDRHGGRRVLSAGSVLAVASLCAIALSQNLLQYYCAWAVLGFAMRLSLYDAAFAALARIGGPAAKRPIAGITLLGGLAATVFWPIGHALVEAYGWRAAVFAYAGFAALTLPLNLMIPAGRYGDGPPSKTPVVAPLAGTPRELMLASVLYALIVTLANVLNAGMSAHMIDVMTGLGVAASVAVWIATLRGIGQSLSRLTDVLFGARLHPIMLNLGASAVLPVCFVAGLFGGSFVAAAVAFAFVYGASNGLLTITRGTLPLVLFDPATYGAVVGRLLMPSFFLSAAAPFCYALVMDAFGPAAALYLSLGLAAITLAASFTLFRRFGRRA